MSHYDVLGVPTAADQATIRRAYRRLARLTHPDLGGDPAEFAAVALAWSVLSDPEARARHDAELAGGLAEADWGEDVALGAPIPVARPTAGPAPGDSPADAPADASADAADSAGTDSRPAGAPVDPFTSPPRALPQPDTSGIVRRYPRPIGGWAFLAYAAVVVVAIGLVIAFSERMAVSSAAFAGLLAYSCVLVGLLALRALPTRPGAAAVFAALLYGAVLAFALGGSAWVADAVADDDRGTRVVVAGAGLLLSLAAAAAVEVRRARALRVERELRRVYEAAVAARRWNLLLHALEQIPDAELRDGEVRPVGSRRTEPGWAVVDPLGEVGVAASEADLAAWCDALRSAGIDVVPATRPAGTAAEGDPG